MANADLKGEPLGQKSEGPKWSRRDRACKDAYHRIDRVAANRLTGVERPYGARPPRGRRHDRAVPRLGALAAPTGLDRLSQAADAATAEAQAAEQARMTRANIKALAGEAENLRGEESRRSPTCNRIGEKLRGTPPRPILRHSRYLLRARDPDVELKRPRDEQRPAF